MLRVLDLFSGIGGFSLGLERTGGFKTVAFCEIEEYPRKVLAKHWPGVPIYEDVKEIMADTNQRHSHEAGEIQAGRELSGPRGFVTDGTTRVGPIDVITGGFPCTDISYAGRGAGIEGEQSGLWSEIARLTGELRPRYVILENVSALLSRGLERVLGDLASIGYDAEWHCIPASHIGAPHQRDRIWIVAYPAGNGLQNERITGCAEQAQPTTWGNGAGLSHPDQPRLQGRLFRSIAENKTSLAIARRGEDVADTMRFGQQGQGEQAERGNQAPGSEGQTDYAESVGIGHIWATEPDVGRVAHGIPKRVDRLKGLGNAVVPQIPELIGRAILEVDSANAQA